jgi:cell division protein FtsB
VPPSTHARRDVHRRAVPAYPRRVSGPARPRAVTAPARPGTAAFERLRALPDHRLVDRLLRGRAWIWLIGLLLGGIVAVQVSLLKLNAGISRAVEATGTLQRQNASLESEIARLNSGERIRAAAVRAGMVDPAAGDTRYLRARPGRDAALAARRMQPPSSAAQAVMANHGRAAGLVAASPLGTATATSAPIAPIGTATPVPAATAAPAAPATATPVPTATGATAAAAPTATPGPAATAAPATPTTATPASTAQLGG